MSLEQSRIELNYLLDHLWKTDWVKTNWPGVSAVINKWWIAYKQWEAADTFHEAFMDDRMTVRTFEADFKKQVNKTIPSHRFAIPDDRFFADSKYTPLDSTSQKDHGKAMHVEEERKKYHADRGIDSSAFADPENFASREMKYSKGLHDLSASLLNHSAPIFAQVHHQGDGAHYSFYPLSMEQDQEVLYRLIQLAKQSRATIPALYQLVRGYRAQMTRVKLAQDSDMGVGFIAIPMENAEPGPDNPAMYRVRYGLGATTTPTPILDKDGKKPPAKTVTAQIYEERKKAARKFKEILRTEYAKANLHNQKGGSKNEIVIALRQHAGEFPVCAIRRGNTLECYNVLHDSLMVPNGKKITANGVMT